MSTQKNKCNLFGVIEARFGWNTFPRQKSFGLISGRFNSNISIDCDAKAVFCKKDGTPISKELDGCCLYFGNEKMFDGAAVHLGDNQIGGSGDDETIKLDLEKMPPEVDLIILTLDLFKEKKRVAAGRIQEAFVRIVDSESGKELVRNVISNFYSGSKMIVVGRICRSEDGWQLVKDDLAIQVKNMNDFIKAIPM